MDVGTAAESNNEVLASMLECGLCLSLLCEPISLGCGHTFCRNCLVSSLQRSAKKCPCCRAICHTRAEDQPPNVALSQIIKSFFPRQLEQRVRETEAEKAKYELCLPAFFYNIPMFPGETLSLHLFEPRYKLMMQRIVNTTRRFAYVPNYGRYAANKGDAALVAEVFDAEFLSDGRVLLKAKLAGRYIIQDSFVEEGTQGLHYCQLQQFEDKSLQGTELAELTGLHTEARELVNKFVGPFKSQVVASQGEMPPDVVGLSMWMCSFLPMNTQDKHALLLSTCTRKRLRACLDCIASIKAAAGEDRKERQAAQGSAPIAQEESVPSGSTAAAGSAAAPENGVGMVVSGETRRG